MSVQYLGGLHLQLIMISKFTPHFMRYESGESGVVQRYGATQIINFKLKNDCQANRAKCGVAAKTA